MVGSFAWVGVHPFAQEVQVLHCGKEDKYYFDYLVFWDNTSSSET